MAALTADPTRNASSALIRRRQSAPAPSASYQRYSEYMPANARPRMSRTAASPNASISHRRMFMSHSNALLAQPSFHLAADLRQTLGAARFVARDDNRLRIGCADQAPSVSEQHAHTVDVDDVVA